MRLIDLALKMLTRAREKWMLNHNSDFDADFYAGLFENARISLEKINENCSEDKEDKNNEN